MKKLIYMGIGLFLCLSAALWTGCDKPDGLEDNDTGCIKGVVKDNDAGTLIFMATVELLPTGTQMMTDSMGIFSFSGLKSGTYQLRVSKEGYVIDTNDIVVSAGQTINRTILLEQGHPEIQILDMDDNVLSVLDLKKTLTFRIKNSGNVAVEWEIPKSTIAWIKGVSKKRWILEPGASDTIELMINGEQLLDGENEAEVLINSSAGDKRLTVRAEMHFAVGSDYVETAFGMELQMVAVQGGPFSMGATPEQNVQRVFERPVHEVVLDGFYIGKYEVTQVQWEAVMGTTIEEQEQRAVESDHGYDEGIVGKGTDYPMYYVSWHDCAEFCEKLSQMTGKKYRLPTEAEWEYAARGGQHADGTQFSGSDDIGEVGWIIFDSDHPDYGTHPVGQKQPNGLDLYDMTGNVFEWCSDWSDWYNKRSVINPQGPTSGSERILRGGGWKYNPEWVYYTVCGRGYYMPDGGTSIFGFRVVCEAK
ncbi:MAG: SUMF1/EgtB/PvdO family nonheme iron enzyme [Bacteroidales bacterium]|nr:SUMF1/EgtB/PvdO family nonheme iron enzyme [Bacteroidales bacterium]